MGTKESNIVASICRWLDTLKPHCKYMKVHGGPHQERGTPDLLIIYRGCPFLMEVKKPGGRTTKLQRHRLTEWTVAGATCGVVRSKSEAQEMMGLAIPPAA